MPDLPSVFNAFLVKWGHCHRMSIMCTAVAFENWNGVNSLKMLSMRFA
jgi:hypothetical protein